MLHSRLYNQAKTSANGFDFRKQLEAAEPLFQSSDLTVVNQESLVAGSEIGLSSFPKFNSPVEIAELLKEYNVDLINLANNHVLDKGEKGLNKSLENLDKLNLPYIGAYKSAKDKNTMRIFQKNGLRICFLSLTKRMAGMKVPPGKEYMLDYFEENDVLKPAKFLRKLKKDNVADVFIISIHFGKEYHRYPTSDQKEISATLSDAGADVIIGHHPHVLQPPEYITNSKGKKTFVMYSLGNFFTGQEGLYRKIGAFMNLDIVKKQEEPNVVITNPKLQLTMVDPYDNKDYKLELLENVVTKLDNIKTPDGTFATREVYDELIKHLTSSEPDIEVR
ncbi:poly-gamma-glutamate synthesis protein (capsule biosynthesis protein) [Salisediminibacterium halotolerans]|nr:poly-gamma-glutamate synthesis protein (capsule biosynthesis protein) [Actinophytocola xinjiangensis]RPE89451.1 poly-gamma-glutamate synthesis protein (capsule biosynthesis protein) [Salisediminibacterium halotolerans]TWG36210.1 poly-gamma-glutamate synthesis protein (capsule biosynthesis protein) [Salisediminibacterium halotolerans]